MFSQLTSSGGMGAVVVVLGVLASATVAVVTGHISGSEYVGVLAGLGIAGAPVATAHVVGTQVNRAAQASPPTPAVPGPPPGQVV